MTKIERIEEKVFRIAPQGELKEVGFDDHLLIVKVINQLVKGRFIQHDGNRDLGVVPEWLGGDGKDVRTRVAVILWVPPLSEAPNQIIEGEPVRAYNFDANLAYKKMVKVRDEGNPLSSIDLSDELSLEKNRLLYEFVLLRKRDMESAYSVLCEATRELNDVRMLS